MNEFLIRRAKKGDKDAADTIQDRDISTVDIYILDYIQYMDKLKGEDNYNNNENKPEGQKWSDLLDQYAKYHKTLHFE